MSKEGAILNAIDVSIGYRLKRGSTSVVSRNLSLSLARGELVCLLGPNGAGKSTLIRALAGLDEPLEGSIELEGTDLSSMTPIERARSTSVVLTDPIPFGLFTVYSLVALGRQPHTRWLGALSERDKERIDWALNALGISALAARQVSALSDGERQKVLIARALAQEASVLLLDEPTAFVDLPRRVELMKILADLAHDEGIAVLVSTHDLELSLRCADRLWLMAEGGAIIEGMPEELALRGEMARAFGSEAIEWDGEQGGFRLKRTPTRFAQVDGEGEAALWTRRALARNGIGLAEDAPLEIKVISQNERLSWHVRSGTVDHSFHSLSELIDGL